MQHADVRHIVEEVEGNFTNPQDDTSLDDEGATISPRILPAAAEDEVGLGLEESCITCIWNVCKKCAAALSGTSQQHGYEMIKGREEEEDDDEEKEKNPHHRRLLDMLRLENIAIMMSYLCVGFALTFITTPITYYAVDSLDASSQMTNTLSIVQQLPWTFKLLYGLLSDCIPILGRRRKPYFIIGYTIYVLSNLILAFIGTPDINALISLVFLQVAGYMLADVMADALIVERSKFEVGGAVGSIQASGYLLRYMGNILGSTLGTLLYNKTDWGWGLSISQIFFLNGSFALLFVFPFIYHLKDFEVNEIRSLSGQCRLIWQTVQKRSIYEPMCFIYVYNILMVPNAAWSNFLIDGLGFTDWMIGVVSIAGAVFAWFGILFYRYLLFNDSWRHLYMWTTIIVFLFSSMQLLLIFQINQIFGISDLWFSLGDTAIDDFVMAIQFLPMVKMYLQLCPEGAEGTTYAMLTTYGNTAYACSYQIGTLLVYAFNITNASLENGDWSAMWKLTLVTSLLNPLALFFISYIPETPAHQRQLQKNEERSVRGGVIFLGVLIFSLIWSLVQTIVLIYVG